MFKNAFLLSIVLHLLFFIALFFVAKLSFQKTIKLTTHNIQIVSSAKVLKTPLVDNTQKTLDTSKPLEKIIEQKINDNKPSVLKPKPETTNNNLNTNKLKKVKTPSTNSNFKTQVNTLENNVKQQPIKEAIKELAKQPAKQPAKEIQKDQEFGDFLSGVIKQNESEKQEKNKTVEDIFTADIMSNAEKDALRNQLYKCGLAVNFLITQDIVIVLKFLMNADATTNNVEIVKITTGNLTQSDLESLKVNILNALKSPNCLKLPLPSNKYNLWKEFTLTLNLKSLF